MCRRCKTSNSIWALFYQVRGVRCPCEPSGGMDAQKLLNSLYYLMYKEGGINHLPRTAEFYVNSAKINFKKIGKVLLCKS